VDYVVKTTTCHPTREQLRLLSVFNILLIFLFYSVLNRVVNNEQLKYVINNLLGITHIREVDMSAEKVLEIKESVESAARPFRTLWQALEDHLRDEDLETYDSVIISGWTLKSTMEHSWENELKHPEQLDLIFQLLEKILKKRGSSLPLLELKIEGNTFSIPIFKEETVYSIRAEKVFSIEQLYWIGKNVIKCTINNRYHYHQRVFDGTHGIDSYTGESWSGSSLKEYDVQIDLTAAVEQMVTLEKEWDKLVKEKGEAFKWGAAKKSLSRLFECHQKIEENIQAFLEPLCLKIPRYPKEKIKQLFLNSIFCKYPELVEIMNFHKEYENIVKNPRHGVLITLEDFAEADGFMYEVKKAAAIQAKATYRFHLPKVFNSSLAPQYRRMFQAACEDASRIEDLCWHFSVFSSHCFGDDALTLIGQMRENFDSQIEKRVNFEECNSFEKLVKGFDYFQGIFKAQRFGAEVPGDLRDRVTLNFAGQLDRLIEGMSQKPGIEQLKFCLVLIQAIHSIHSHKWFGSVVKILTDRMDKVRSNFRTVLYVGLREMMERKENFITCYQNLRDEIASLLREIKQHGKGKFSKDSACAREIKRLERVVEENIFPVIGSLFTQGQEELMVDLDVFIKQFHQDFSLFSQADRNQCIFLLIQKQLQIAILDLNDSVASQEMRNATTLQELSDVFHNFSDRMDHVKPGPFSRSPASGSEEERSVKFFDKDKHNSAMKKRSYDTIFKKAFAAAGIKDNRRERQRKTAEILQQLQRGSLSKAEAEAKAVEAGVAALPEIVSKPVSDAASAPGLREMRMHALYEQLPEPGAGEDSHTDWRLAEDARKAALVAVHTFEQALEFFKHKMHPVVAHSDEDLSTELSHAPLSSKAAEAKVEEDASVADDLPPTYAVATAPAAEAPPPYHAATAPDPRLMLIHALEEELPSPDKDSPARAELKSAEEARKAALAAVETFEQAHEFFKQKMNVVVSRQRAGDPVPSAPPASLSVFSAGFHGEQPHTGKSLGANK